MPDLSPYTYSDLEYVDVEGRVATYRPRYERLAVGWLTRENPFPTGRTDPEFVDALVRIHAERRVNTTRGFQVCVFCPPPRDRRAMPRPTVTYEGSPLALFLGHREIRVPHLVRPPLRMFAAPNLILHYVSEHAYLPPQEFVDGVMCYDPSWATLVAGDWFPVGTEVELAPRRIGVLTRDGVRRRR